MKYLETFLLERALFCFFVCLMTQDMISKRCATRGSPMMSVFLQKLYCYRVPYDAPSNVMTIDKFRTEQAEPSGEKYPLLVKEHAYTTS